MLDFECYMATMECVPRALRSWAVETTLPTKPFRLLNIALEKPISNKEFYDSASPYPKQLNEIKQHHGTVVLKDYIHGLHDCDLEDGMRHHEVASDLCLLKFWYTCASPTYPRRSLS